MKVRKQRWRFYRKKGGPYRSIGLRCKGEQEPCCIVCASYAYLELHGRFPSFDTARAMTQEAMQQEES